MPFYKDGKQTRVLEPETFRNIMDEGRFVEPLRDKSFLAILYWLGIRRSEVLDLVKEDFTIDGDLLLVNATPKKGGEREALEVAVTFPYVNLIVERVNRTRRTKSNPTAKVWPMSAATAWRIVKRVLPKHYPHFFRLNRATKFLEDPTTTIPEMMAWFGWRQAKTVSPYIGLSKRYIHEQRRRLKREADEFSRKQNG